MVSDTPQQPDDRLLASLKKSTGAWVKLAGDSFGYPLELEGFLLDVKRDPEGVWVEVESATKSGEWIDSMAFLTRISLFERRRMSDEYE